MGSSGDILKQKRRLRRDLLLRRDQLADREASSEAIRVRVSELPAFRRARAIHCYLSIRSEVETRGLIATALAHGKAVAVPLIGPDQRMHHSWIRDLDLADFTEGAHGTLVPRVFSPALPGDWDVTVVPLLGFDRHGYRIGYGKGYYDQLLSDSPTYAIGLAFAAQEVARLPHEQHDQRLDVIVSEGEVIVVER